MNWLIFILVIIYFVVFPSHSLGCGPLSILPSPPALLFSLFWHYDNTTENVKQMISFKYVSKSYMKFRHNPFKNCFIRLKKSASVNFIYMLSWISVLCHLSIFAYIICRVPILQPGGLSFLLKISLFTLVKLSITRTCRSVYSVKVTVE